jgi:hypothetical protein
LVRASNVFVVNTTLEGVSPLTWWKKAIENYLNGCKFFQVISYLMIKRIKRTSIIAPHQFVVIPFPASKIILKMCQVNLDGWEAMVWVPCWLDTWIQAQKGYFAGWFLKFSNWQIPALWETIDPHPSHPKSFCGCAKWAAQYQFDAILQVHGSFSQPSKIILLMFQVNLDGWEAIV